MTDIVAQLAIDAQKMHDIVHGDDTTVVTTDGGPVRSVAKLIADNQQKIDDAAGVATSLTGPGAAATIATSSGSNVQAELDAKANAADLAASGGAALIGAAGGGTVQDALDAKATPADVTAAIDALVAGAPAALDTLKELADAVNDDANFAASVTTQLGQKVNSTDLAAAGGAALVGTSDGWTAQAKLDAHGTSIAAKVDSSALAASGGAGLVGFMPAGVGAAQTDVQTKLRELPSVPDYFLAAEADSTGMFQRAANRGGRVLVPAGTYTIDSVSLTKSIEFACESGVTFKRLGGADAASGSYWAAGAAMFEVDAAGLTVKFTGSYTYDGNSSNQTAVEPTGMFLKTYPPAVITGLPTVVYLGNGVFKNGTSGYLALRGDNYQRRYETIVYLENCRFYDTIKGKGKGDPSTPNALGYLPTYVYVMDYVRLNTLNFRAEWNAPLATGEYAACALNGTFFGNVYADSGESYIYMYGTTYVKGLGRSAKKYNDDTDWVTNNGIGALDCYGNAHTFFVEKLVAENTENVAMRSKGSLKHYTVLDATLINCHRGLQVGPSTTGACETIVKIGNVNTTGGTIPQLEFVGSSTSDMLPSVTIDSAYVAGAPTNIENLVAQGAVRILNVGKLSGKAIGVFGAPQRGLEIQGVTRSAIKDLVINTTTNGEGVYVSGGESFDITGFDIKNTGNATGITIATNPKKATVRNGRITNAVNYGVFSNTTTTRLTVESVDVDTVSGTGRGFYAGGGDVTFIDNSSTGAATPLFTVAGTRVREQHNSWNPAESQGTAAPTTGTWSVGDKVWNKSPVAGGTAGWVCTTAGAPGTWKAFGTIAA